MFKTFALRLAACAATAFAAAGIAQAADLPSRVVAPIVPLPPAPTWTGFYIGVSAGGDFLKNSFTTNQVASGFATNYGTAVADLNDERARVGGYLGYNYQINDFVVGVEGDGAYDFGHAHTSSGLPGETYVNGASVDLFSGKSFYDFSARGRAGFLMFPSALFYVTGGAAFRDSSYTAICAGGANSFCAQPLLQSYSGIRTGWTVGGGVEGMLTPNLIARIEYRYSDLGSRSLNFFGTPNGASGDFFGGRADMSASTVTLGLAYKLNVLQPAVPVVARY